MYTNKLPKVLISHLQIYLYYIQLILLYYLWQIYYEIIEEPSSSSYEYKVAASAVGYDELCEKVAEYVENNVERLSGYTMDKLTNKPSETGDDYCTFLFSFMDGSFLGC